MSEETDALVVGAGPAGLMAAEVLSKAVDRVTLVDAMPTPARKFLMAGKSGLNLTKSEPLDQFLKAYGDHANFLAPAIRAFGPEEVRAWAEGLEQEVFTGTTGRVFPKRMKASPLLRAWLTRLAGAGVELRNRWSWRGWEGDGFAFETPDGHRSIKARACVLALGGASWRRLGSDGAWAGIFEGANVQTQPFLPSNAGIRIKWTPHMQRHFGLAVKGAKLTAGGIVSRGEFVISKGGLEGGGVYSLTPALRGNTALNLDLKPDLSLDELTARIMRAPKKMTTKEIMRKNAGLSPGAIALIQEFSHPTPRGVALAEIIKSLNVTYEDAGPLDAAISTAGGARWSELDPSLMLHKRPGVFLAGEMLDWEAPTGGYLVTACLATGRLAGQSAARYLQS